MCHCMVVVIEHNIVAAWGLFNQSTRFAELIGPSYRIVKSKGRERSLPKAAVSSFPSGSGRKPLIIVQPLATELLPIEMERETKAQVGLF